MKFEWRMPDKTEVTINHPDEIATVMSDLKARLENAKSAGLEMKAAALAVQYDDQYKQWLLCMAFHYQDDRKELSLLIARTKQAFAWWDEWSAQDNSKTEVSEIQRSLLQDLPSDLWPRSWAEAAKIINRNPKFRAPSADIEVAMQRLAKVLSIASPCLKMAGDLATRFSKEERPASSELDTYHAKIVQLKEAMNDAGLILANRPKLARSGQ